MGLSWDDSLEVREGRNNRSGSSMQPGGLVKTSPPDLFNDIV